MSTHIGAEKGQIAQDILLPGDPLRAKFIAENFLQDVECYTQIRGMFGFTGTYKGKKVSVQGTGMGMPSLSIYVTELFREYGVKNAIRIGTCGSLCDSLEVGSVILAQSACSDSGILNQLFGNLHYTPISDFDLLLKTYEIAKKRSIPVVVGSVISSDLFYDPNENWKKWKEYGVKAVEMECAELFTLGAKYNRKTLGILSVSDNIITGTELSAQERQTKLVDMIELSLETLLEL